MNILDSFSRGEPLKSKERKARKVRASGKPERREKKQKVSKTAILNGTTFTVVVKLFGFLLGLVAVLAVAYAAYLGIMIFIED